MTAFSASKCFLLVLITLCLTASRGFAQQPTLRGNDSTRLVNILFARDSKYIKKDSASQLSILVGDVRMEQNGTLFFCDSCVMNDALHRFEAFGKVHIKQGDSTDIYSDYLEYHSDTKKAHLNGRVKLTDKESTLTTPELDYDMNTSIASYNRGGTLVNKTTKLTSKEGVYYNDIKDAYFKKDVVLDDPAYHLETDSLLYNSEFRTARFIAETNIRDSANRTIITREGFYNLATRNAEFGQNPVIRDGALTITGNRVYFDDSTHISIIERNGVVRDTAQGFVLLGNLIFRNNENESMLATRQPLAIIKQDQDSIYITADTLFSARLSDLPQRRVPATAVPDSLRYGIDSSGDLATEDPLPKDGLSRNRMEKPSLRKDRGTDSDAPPLRQPTPPIKKEPVPALVTPDIAQTDSISRKPEDSTFVAEMATPPPPGPPAVPDTAQLKLPGKLTALRSADSISTDSSGLALADTSATGDLAAADSTNRYFEGYHHVRIYSDSMQAISDSVFYSFRDSTFRMFDHPVVWSKDSQITGDTIYLYTRNKQPDKLEVYNNSFLVNEVEPEIYNQISGKRLDGYFLEGELDSVRVRGNTETIYFVQDEDSAYSGINQATADILDAYFSERQLQRVVFRSEVKGTLWPIQQKSPVEMRLPNFQWLEALRPKTKYDLFE